MRQSAIAFLAFAFVLSACEGVVPTAPVDDVVDQPVDTRPPLGSISFTRPNTLFISSQSSVAPNGGWYTEGFTLNTRTSFLMRYATDFTAQIAIMPASERSRFENGQTVNVFHIWDGGAGTEPITLDPGEYAVGVRNFESVRQDYSVELDLEILQLAPEHGYTFTFASHVFSDATSINANGGWAWQSFTVTEGFRYFIDGTSTRVTTWLIPPDQVADFEAGRSFQFFADFAMENAGPGLWEVDLPPGTYYLAMRSNDPEVDGLVTYNMEAWRIQ